MSNIQECGLCHKEKPLSNWAARTIVGDQPEEYHENVCVDCSEALLLLGSSILDVGVELKQKCECCHKVIKGESLYHPGTHKYVCSYACHKYETDVLIETFSPLEKSYDKTGGDVPKV